MPQAAHELKDNGWVHNETIHKFLSLTSVHFLLPAIADMMDGLCVKRLLVSEPLQGGPRLIDPGPMPTLRGLHGDVVVKMFLPPIEVTGGCNRGTFLKGVEVCLAFEFLGKFLTPALQ